MNKQYYHAISSSSVDFTFSATVYLAFIVCTVLVICSPVLAVNNGVVNSNETIVVKIPKIVDEILFMPPSSGNHLVNYFEEISASVYLVTIQNQELRDSPTGSGSAVAINKNTLLTNCHIFGKKINLDGNIIKVIKKGSPVLNGKLINQQVESDKCILEVDGVLTPVKGVRSMKSFKVGERVYAIGNPKGFIDAFAEGLISAIRPSKKTGTVILTTTGIAKGSSGGALFDGGGNLIGITTAVISDAPHLAIVIPAESFLE